MDRLISTDGKGRMNLGKHYAQMYFLMHEQKDGNIILEKAAVVPERELWLHKNPKAKKSLLRGIEQARKGQGKKNAIDLDVYDVRLSTPKLNFSCMLQNASCETKQSLSRYSVKTEFT